MRERFGKIILPDHSGDQAIAEFDPGVDNDKIEIAQEKLTKFLEDCIERYGSTPPVFARRINETVYTPFNADFLSPKLKRDPNGQDSLLDVETVVIQRPMAGG